MVIASRFLRLFIYFILVSVLQYNLNTLLGQCTLDFSCLGLVSFECDIKGNIYPSSNTPATFRLVERLSSYLAER